MTVAEKINGRLTEENAPFVAEALSFEYEEADVEEAGLVDCVLISADFLSVDNLDESVLNDLEYALTR